MLVTMKEILEQASRGNYAVAAPNVCCEIDARAAIASAEKLNAPIILDVAANMTPDLAFFGKYLCGIAEQCRIPVALNLDHGGASAGKEKDFAVYRDFMHAVQGGFTSVMIDCSSLPFEENVEKVAEFVKYAHAVGISVEAELGHVGDAEKYETEREKALTDPALAKEYVERTGVDCLAVSIGNAHGLYKGKPFLDFERLQAIKEAVDGLPLVLHGGSGTGEENLSRACGMGINKVNYGTDLYVNMCKTMNEADFSGSNCYNLWVYLQSAFMEQLEKAIVMFGGQDKAWKVEKMFRPAANMLCGNIKE